MKKSKLVNNIIKGAVKTAELYKNKYLMPEHLIYSLCFNEKFKHIFEAFNIDVSVFMEDLETFFEDAEKGNKIIETSLYKEVFKSAECMTIGNKMDTITLNSVILSLLELEDTFFMFLVDEQIDESYNLTKAFAHVEMGDEKECKKIEIPTEEDFDDEEDEPIVEEPMDGPQMFVNGIPIGKVPLPHELSKFFSMMNGFGPIPMPMMKPGENLSKNGEKSTNLKFLSKYGVCLNDKEFKPVIGRDYEVEQTCRTLARKDKCNPIHVGEPGVGKTAVVHALVQAIKAGTVPNQIKDAIIYEISLGELVAGTQYRGEFEERLKGIIKDATSNPNIILYIDEIHQLVGSGATGSGSIDGAQILKPYLNDGSIKCIGATTYAEYKKFIEKDSALQRRFKKIEISEPTEDEAILILKGLKETYEKHHNVTITEEAIDAAVKLSNKFLNEKFLPDKAIDLIDESSAFVNQKNINKRVVSKEIIQQIIAETCNIPSVQIEKDEQTSLKNLEKDLKGVVFGQDKAIESLVESIIINRAGLTNDNKPMGTYLFVGPTGTGKTEVAKQLSEKLGLKLLRYDMSEYMEKHSVAKLIGAPAGYVGYEEGGLLTEDIRKNPYSILLLDEFEKAHSDIYNMFLQVMDNAQLTDNQGRIADFRNVIIIMTSNAGASMLGQKSLGFNAVSKDSSVITETLEKTFAPEFRNRLSGTIIFNSMNEEMAEKIAKKQLDILKNTLKEKGITLKVSKNVISTIISRNIKSEFGGREIIRIIEKEIKPLFSKPIVFGELKSGDTCTLGVKDNQFILK